MIILKKQFPCFNIIMVRNFPAKTPKGARYRGGSWSCGPWSRNYLCVFFSARTKSWVRAWQKDWDILSPYFATGWPHEGPWGRTWPHLPSLTHSHLPALQASEDLVVEVAQRAGKEECGPEFRSTFPIVCSLPSPCCWRPYSIWRWQQWRGDVGQSSGPHSPSFLSSPMGL